MLYYSSPQIVVQEVPGELALALSISGCKKGCKGCHSKHTHLSTYGEPLTVEVLSNLISKHRHISCVLFYGGEWEVVELIRLLTLVKKKGKKTCLYTGEELEDISPQLLLHLDYIKVGAYVEALGGLESPTTNQRFLTL